MLIKKVVSKFHLIYIIRKYKSNPYMLSSKYLHDYKEHKMPYHKIYAIHKKGYTVEDWQIMGVTNNNYKEYLSSADYRAMHPINGSYSKWIDDKLTFKYLCAGTELNNCMPKYYYQIDEYGNILCLSDNKHTGVAKLEDIINLLIQQKELALKKISGSIGIGFYKLEYLNDKFLVNGVIKTENELSFELGKLKDYLVMEYLRPNKEIAKFCSSTTNTLRYIIARDKHNNIINIRSFIRYGTKQSNFVENFGAGGVLCYVDNDGNFDKGYVLDLETYQKHEIAKHPDNNVELKGRIPMWNDIIITANKVADYFPQLKYMGIDFVITDKNEIKILEINSLTSLDSIQADGSILNKNEGYFFKELLNNR